MITLPMSAGQRLMPIHLYPVHTVWRSPCECSHPRPDAPPQQLGVWTCGMPLKSVDFVTRSNQGMEGRGTLRTSVTHQPAPTDCVQALLPLPLLGLFFLPWWLKFPPCPGPQGRGQQVVFLEIPSLACSGSLLLWPPVAFSLAYISSFPGEDPQIGLESVRILVNFASYKILPGNPEVPWVLELMSFR